MTQKGNKSNTGGASPKNSKTSRKRRNNRTVGNE